MACVPDWQIKQVSEDFCDYSRDDYNYLQLEHTSENFEPSPPISVAEYKARTLAILPKGIFDNGDVEGMLVHSKDIRHSVDIDEDYYSFGQISENSEKINKLFDKSNNEKLQEYKQNKESPKNDASKNPGNSKKKKKKFKKFDYSPEAATCDVYQVPFVPDFSDKFKRREFPPL